VVQVVDECLVSIQPRGERAFELRSNAQSSANPFRVLGCSDFVTEPEGYLVPYCWEGKVQGTILKSSCNLFLCFNRL
jgi:hypothetical protein